MDQQIKAHLQTFEAIRSLAPQLDAAGQIIINALKSGGKIFVCGNGGSAAEGQHFVTELVGRYKYDRQPLPAIWLGGDTGLMTCIANDFEWNEVFARPLRGLAQPGDVLLCLSTSGKSSNAVRALQVAEEMKLKSVALLGEAGEMAALATVPLVVGSHGTARVQEAHLFFIHCICDMIEEAFPVIG